MIQNDPLATLSRFPLAVKKNLEGSFFKALYFALKLERKRRVNQIFLLSDPLVPIINNRFNHCSEINYLSQVFFVGMQANT